MTELLRRRRAVFVVENASKNIEDFLANERYVRIDLYPALPLMNSILAPDTLPREHFRPTATQIAEALEITSSLQGA